MYLLPISPADVLSPEDGWRDREGLRQQTYGGDRIRHETVSVPPGPLSRRVEGFGRGRRHLGRERHRSQGSMVMAIDGVSPAPSIALGSTSSSGVMQAGESPGDARQPGGLRRHEDRMEARLRGPGPGAWRGPPPGREGSASKTEPASCFSLEAVQGPRGLAPRQAALTASAPWIGS